ncbi:uncharacterized protein LOC101861144 [Aplysia californica]|uniref:Uncharacterized protein LOC101861144 n=1 Tax=Aplysia californica TaxID=6500 RepID=A0ABM1A5Q1_APLCA|nr:uncharacterized protein LOC101861144 [Aplysia californica]
MKDKDKPKTKSSAVKRKAKDVDFQYTCEWMDCSHKEDSMNLFNHHVSQHRLAYFQQIVRDSGADSATGDFSFYCHWRDCGAQVEGKLAEFSRHLFYHTFHQYLKFLGQHIQEVEALEPCCLDSSSRNLIPELPERLLCRWDDCTMEYENPYIFYSHVSHHCEDFPKGNNPKVVIRCKWEGCQANAKSWFKMKEHLRSHTQAKVVACPTCGSLFANNTKFVDHLQRQRLVVNGKKFECSHCGSQFGSERILRDHIRHHVNHYKCPLCDMTCPSPSALRDHVRYRHSNQREFSCTLCDYKAKVAGDLRKHQQTHDRKNFVVCQYEDCGATFSQREYLLQHYTDEHQPTSGLGPYQCHICNRKFTRGTLLTDHLQADHNYKWPSGHRRFRYKQHEDGVRRLQTIRYESIEVSQEVLGHKLSPHPAVGGSNSGDGDGGGGARNTDTGSNNNDGTSDAEAGTSQLLIAAPSPCTSVDDDNINDLDYDDNDVSSSRSVSVSVAGCGEPPKKGGRGAKSAGLSKDNHGKARAGTSGRQRKDHDLAEVEESQGNVRGNPKKSRKSPRKSSSPQKSASNLPASSFTMPLLSPLKLPPARKSSSSRKSSSPQKAKDSQKRKRGSGEGGKGKASKSRKIVDPDTDDATSASSTKAEHSVASSSFFLPSFLSAAANLGFAGAETLSQASTSSSVSELSSIRTGKRIMSEDFHPDVTTSSLMSISSYGGSLKSPVESETLYTSDYEQTTSDISSDVSFPPLLEASGRINAHHVSSVRAVSVTTASPTLTSPSQEALSNSLSASSASQLHKDVSSSDNIVRLRSEFRSPTKVHTGSNFGPLSFSPEKLGFTVTDASGLEWNSSPVKVETGNVSEQGMDVVWKTPHAVDLSTSVPNCSTVEVGVSAEWTQLKEEHQSETQINWSTVHDDGMLVREMGGGETVELGGGETAEVSGDNQMYNLEMLGAVALGTRLATRKRKKSETS